MTTNRIRIAWHLVAKWPHQCLVSGRSVAAIIFKRLCFGLLAICYISPQASAADGAAPLFAHEGAVAPPTIETQPFLLHQPKRANFEREPSSDEAHHLADWIVDSVDNRNMPFAIIDKADAKVFVFDADGQLRGAAPVLLGLARGDDAVPGIGKRALSSIRPDERTTPAGRFVAALDHNLHGKEILWVDYEGAVSLHPVITTKPSERRLQRLATPTPLDNRISYGCINVPVQFFKNVVRPVFTGTNGIVYVLPETRSANEVFTSYDVEEHAQPQVAAGVTGY